MTIAEIITLLAKHTGRHRKIEAGTPVLSTGLLDSYHFAAFLESLRSRFHVTIDVVDIGVDNFDTPTQMLAFLRGRQ
jgi:hypothetical protein